MEADLQDKLAALGRASGQRAGDAQQPPLDEDRLPIVSSARPGCSQRSRISVTSRAIPNWRCSTRSGSRPRPDGAWSKLTRAVRLSPEELAAVKAAAARDGLSLPGALREGFLRYAAEAG